MNINEFIRPVSVVLMVLCVLLSAATFVTAEKKIIEADGYAIMGDGPEENPAVAQERARKDAKRAASEQAGVYVESLSEVQKGLLTRDEVRTISANILEVQSDPITVEVLSGIVIRYHCHITVLVDTDIVTAQLSKGKDKLEDAVKLNQDQEVYTAQRARRVEGKIQDGNRNREGRDQQRSQAQRREIHGDAVE